MALMNQRLNAEDRDGVHDAGRAVHLHQLAADQGSVLARRPGARPGAGARRSSGCARKGCDERTHDELADRTDAHCQLADDEGDGDGRSAAPRRASRSSTSAPASRTSRRPSAIKAAAHAGARRRTSRSYTPVAGIADLKRAICDRYQADYGVEYQESEVIVTAGGKQALYNTALALFGPGDEVITHAPYWPTLTEQIKLADATPVLVRTARRGRLRDPRASRSSTRSRRGRAASSSTRRAIRPAR